MRISRLVIPQRTDALIVIATHMSVLPLGVLHDARRAQIVRNLLAPMLMLIEALQLVASAGPDEETALMHFIGSVYAQSELTKRNQHLDQLLGKLQVHQRQGQRPS